ncbi:MAG: glycosyltransferase, partial [Bacteroidota bacterium]
CIGTYDNEPLPGVELVPLFSNAPTKYLAPRVGWRIRQYLQHENIRFLGLQHHYFGLLLRPFLLGLDVKVFAFSHNLEFQRWRSIGKWWWPLMKWTERWVYHWAEAVFFISWHEAQDAVSVFGLPPEKCRYAPYVVEPLVGYQPTTSLETIRQAIQADRDEKLLLFFGPQSYAPNREAVRAIVDRIHPILQAKTSFRYRILICGGGLPAEDADIKNKTDEGIHYLGFVPVIEDYVLACNLVLNPVNQGGGVKTKLVEAVALGKTVVSTQTGARGVDPITFGPKLIQVPDTDWQAFAEAIIVACEQPDTDTPTTFWATHGGTSAVRPVVDWLPSINE